MSSSLLDQHPTPGGDAGPDTVKAPGPLLLDEVRAYIARFSVLPSSESLDVVTLWVAHTHITDEAGVLMFANTPRLALLSTGPGSGKSHTLARLLRLCRNGQKVTDPSGSGVVAAVATDHIVIGIDEIDNLFGAGSARAQLQAILNEGYESSAAILRKGTQGRSQRIPCFGPVALAGMGHVYRSAHALAAARTRSIMINMVPGKPPEHYRERLHGQWGDELRMSLSRWGRKHAGAVAETYPDMPEGLDDGRTADIWEPLIAVADAFGEGWGKRARRAALAVTAAADETAEEEIVESPGRRLLAGVVRAFRPGPLDEPRDVVDGWVRKRTSGQVLAAVAGEAGMPRYTGTRADAMHLAGVLRPYGIRPVPLSITMPDPGSPGKMAERTVQGYRWDLVAPQVPAELLEELEAAEEEDEAMGLPID